MGEQKPVKRGRPATYANAAERAKAWRARQKALIVQATSAQSNKFEINLTNQEDIFALLASTVSDVTGQSFLHRLPAQHYIDEMRSLIENIILKMPGYVYLKDRSFKYLLCNQSMLDFFGFSSLQEIVKKTDYDFGWDKTLVDAYRKVDEEIVRTGQPQLGVEEVVYTSKHEPLFLHVNKMPLFNKAGEVIGIVGISVDITAQKEAERLRLESERRHHQLILHEKEKRITLACKVAHDINSPVAALRMMIDSYEELHEDKRTFLRRATESILDIANNLISNYQPEENIINPGIAGIELRELLLVSDLMCHLVSEKKVQYQQHPMTFDIVVAKDAQFAFIKVQKTEFRRSMSNLINNAVDALENNKSGKITIQLTADADVVVVDIIDNGKGMSLDMVEKIQIGQSFTKDKEHGHGLGLRQVWDMLECNQGALEVQSLVGRGSSIQLHFPRAVAPKWIAQEIHLTADSVIVILDDEESIHTAWDLRFAPLIALYPSLQLHHFTRGQEILNFLNNLSETKKKQAVLLSDYELLHQDRNGLQIIEASEIKGAILVTSYYANFQIREAAERMKVKLLPKQMASIIPIFVS